MKHGDLEVEPEQIATGAKRIRSKLMAGSSIEIISKIPVICVYDGLIVGALLLIKEDGTKIMLTNIGCLAGPSADS